MSVVIIGGNERMERRYKDLCEQYKCKAKVYTKKLGDMKRIGSPDLLGAVHQHYVSQAILSTILSETKGQDIKVARCQSSSMSALRNVLDTHVEGALLTCPRDFCW